MKGIKLGLIILLVSGLLLGPGTVRASEDKNIIKIGSDVTIESGIEGPQRGHHRRPDHRRRDSGQQRRGHRRLGRPDEKGRRGGQRPLPGRGDRERAGCAGGREPDGDQLLQPLRNPDGGTKLRMGRVVLDICRHLACHLSRHPGRGAPDRRPPAETGPHRLRKRYAKIPSKWFSAAFWGSS